MRAGGNLALVLDLGQRPVGEGVVPIPTGFRLPQRQQAAAYGLLLTGVYPHSSPSEEERPEGDPFLVEPERPVWELA